MDQLVLIRHAEPSLKDRFQGHGQNGLSSRGVIQAEQLARSRYVSKVGRIYSSDLRRAAQTAAIAFVDHNIQVDNRLRERCFGDWQGLTRDEVRTSYPHSYQQWRVCPYAATPTGGEPYEAMVQRAVAFLDEQADAGKIAVVTHLGMIRVILTLILHVEPSVMAKFCFDHAGVTVVDVQTAVVISLNDTCHIHC